MLYNLGLRCRYCHFLIRRRRKATLRCAEFNPQLHVVRSLNSCARSRIWVVSTMLQNCGVWELRQYPTCGHNVMVTRFGPLVQMSTARQSVSASNTRALLHGHDQITQFSTAPLGSRSPSRCRQSYPKKDARGCCDVLMPVRSQSLLTATVTLCGLGLRFPSSGAFHFSLLRLEVCGTPEQHVSEVQSGDTILTSQVLDPATERSIRERVFERASAAVVQPRRRTHCLLNFCSLSLRAGWTRRSQKAPPLLWCARRFLTAGWSHARWKLLRHVSSTSLSTTIAALQRGCYLRRNATHMQLVKLALTTVVAPMRSDILCVRFFVQYFALLATRFGPGFDTVQSNLPLFPARNGDMLLKHQIITAYRSVIAISGTAPTMIDGIGNTRQRVVGHVCHVVGAVWLYQNLEDLHFVQLFARWGRRLSRGTSQTLRCANKQICQH